MVWICHRTQFRKIRPKKSESTWFCPQSSNHKRQANIKIIKSQDYTGKLHWQRTIDNLPNKTENARQSGIFRFINFAGTI